MLYITKAPGTFIHCKHMEQNLFASDFFLRVLLLFGGIMYCRAVRLWPRKCLDVISPRCVVSVRTK